MPRRKGPGVAQRQGQLVVGEGDQADVELQADVGPAVRR